MYVYQYLHPLTDRRRQACNLLYAQKFLLRMYISRFRILLQTGCSLITLFTGDFSITFCTLSTTIRNSFRSLKLLFGAVSQLIYFLNALRYSGTLYSPEASISGSVQDNESLLIKILNWIF